MKKVKFDACRAVLLAVALLLVPAYWSFGEDVVVTPKTTDAVSTTATGNITRVTLDEIYIKSPGDTHPTGYMIAKNTTYVDDQNAPAQMATLKPGRGVIISYVMQGDNRVATKVVVRNAP